MRALWLKVAALCGGALLVGWVAARAALGQDMHHGVTVVIDCEAMGCVPPLEDFKPHLVRDGSARMTEERCSDLLARYTRRCVPTPRPTIPDPTRTPPPTPAPIPCEPIGGVKTYQDGEEKMLCFTVAPRRFVNPYVEVQSRNHGNATCAYVQMHCTSPTGETYDSGGVQPGCMLRFAAGRYYVWTKFVDPGSDIPQSCRTYTFTVQP